MPDETTDYLRLILQELKALNLRLDRTVDRLEAVRLDLKSEWRTSGKRVEALRSELHADLSILRGELMQLRGLTAVKAGLTPAVGGESEEAAAPTTLRKKRSRKKTATRTRRAAKPRTA